eukprot:2773050-Rhodomonas_salina.2
MDAHILVQGDWPGQSHIPATTWQVNYPPLAWYLGVNIEHNIANKHTKLMQAQYTRDVLECFGMTGAMPVSTPMEPNTHLTVADCPEPYK